MFKKLLWVGVAAAVGIVVLNVTGLAKHVPAIAGKIKTKIEDRIPLEDHIKAIRGEIAKLGSTKDEAMMKLASATVQARRLKSEVADLRPKVEDQRALVKASMDEMEAKEQKVTALERSSFALEFNKLKKFEVQLQAKEKSLVETEQRVTLLKDNLEALLAAQKEAEAQVEALDTERMSLELQQTRSKYQMDDTRLSDIKQSIQKVRNRIDEQRVKLELSAKYGTDTMPSQSQQDGTDALKEAKAYFGQKDAPSAKK